MGNFAPLSKVVSRRVTISETRFIFRSTYDERFSECLSECRVVKTWDNYNTRSTNMCARVFHGKAIQFPWSQAKAWSHPAATAAAIAAAAAAAGWKWSGRDDARGALIPTNGTIETVPLGSLCSHCLSETNHSDTDWKGSIHPAFRLDYPNLTTHVFNLCVRRYLIFSHECVSRLQLALYWRERDFVNLSLRELDSILV